MACGKNSKMPALRRRRRRQHRNRQRLEAVPQRLRRENTLALGALAGLSVAVVFGIEFVRVWRLGAMTRGRGVRNVLGTGRQVVRVVRDGYNVSATRENATFAMLASFIVTFGLARAVTHSIRMTGGIGPFRDVKLGTRHIHHFVPGILLAFAAGGTAIVSRREDVDRWMAVPFGIGVALVLDESALMIELEDVYWSDQGVLSIHAAFAATTLLSLLAYLVQMLRRGEAQLREGDWRAAAKAWDDLQMLVGDELATGGTPEIG
jgi:hypothetical protein